MSDSPISPQRLCPHCGAVVSPTAECCFLCLVKLGAPPESVEPATGEAPPSVKIQQSYSGPADIFLVALVLILLVGTGLALKELPGCTGFLFVLVLAAVPVLVFSSRRSGDRRPAPASSPKSFAAILGIIVCCGVAGYITFFVTCWVGFFAGPDIGRALGADAIGTDAIGLAISWAFIIGATCGIAVAIGLGIRLFRS